MDEKIIAFTKDVKTYRELAKRSMNKGDYEGAFNFLFSALAISKKPYEIYADLGDAYSETGQFERATEYWFKYLNCAPEDKSSIAYEELAVNFFYQDKIFEAGYYFHKKILVDGFVSREGLGEEIADILTDTSQGRTAFHIAYPFDRADYSNEKKQAKKALTMGDYNVASEILEKIPPECMDEDSFGDKAVAHFLQGEDDKTVETCMNSLKIGGENITAYCNLSTHYFNKQDFDKASYYYNKALSCFDKSVDQCYQLASPSIEQQDHQTANECLAKIVKERKYDVVMRLYYGISYLNLGEYERGMEEISFALRLNPYDRVISFYVELAKKLIQKDEKSLALLPLKYQKDYPQKVTAKFKKLIKDLISERRELSILKKRENLDALYWGIYSEDEVLNKECAILLWFAKNVKGHKILTSLLFDPELRGGVKRVIIYTLIIFGYKEKFGVVASNRFKKIKRGKLIFDGMVDGEIFVSAYATLVARMAFWEVDADNEVLNSINKLYEKYREEIDLLALTAEEIATVTTCVSGVKVFSNGRETSLLFGVKYSRIKELVERIQGEEND